MSFQVCPGCFKAVHVLDGVCSATVQTRNKSVKDMIECSHIKVVFLGRRGEKKDPPGKLMASFFMIGLYVCVFFEFEIIFFPPR